MIYIFLIISLIFDYYIPFVIPSFFNQLNIFYPMFTLTYLIFIYKIISNKEYFKIIFIAGILYDLLFSYLFLFNLLFFIIIYKALEKVKKYIQFNFIIEIILLITFIFLYDSILFFLIYMSGYSIVSISDLIYKVSHSIVLNIIYFSWLKIIFKKKIKINKIVNNNFRRKK